MIHLVQKYRKKFFMYLPPEEYNGRKHPDVGGPLLASPCKGRATYMSLATSVPARTLHPSRVIIHLRAPTPLLSVRERGYHSSIRRGSHMTRTVHTHAPTCSCNKRAGMHLALTRASLYIAPRE